MSTVPRSSSREQSGWGALERSAQLGSEGQASDEIHLAAVQAAEPTEGLSWLDIGCGEGDVLRAVRDWHKPAALMGSDLINWLAPDLKSDVRFEEGAAEHTTQGLASADRVLLVEVLEHLEAPWTVLRHAAGRLAPGGRLVVTTPNISTLRHRLELALRGQLTAFRTNNAPHLSPILPHVVMRILHDEGLTDITVSYGGVDVVPFLRGRPWPRWIANRFPKLLKVSVVVTAVRRST